MWVLYRNTVCPTVYLLSECFTLRFHLQVSSLTCTSLQSDLVSATCNIHSKGQCKHCVTSCESTTCAAQLFFLNLSRRCIPCSFDARYQSERSMFRYHAGCEAPGMVEAACRYFAASRKTGLDICVSLLACCSGRIAVIVSKVACLLYAASLKIAPC